MAAAVPFDVTYVPPAVVLPAWLSYTSSATATLVQSYAYATLVSGVPTEVTASLTLTAYETQVIELALTVDAGGAPLAFPYTTAGGDGPTLASVLGATAAFTLQADSASASGGSFGERGFYFSLWECGSSRDVWPMKLLILVQFFVLAAGASPTAVGASTSPLAQPTTSLSEHFCR